MRKDVAYCFISLGVLAACVCGYFDWSNPYLTLATFVVALTSFYMANKIYKEGKIVTILGAVLLLLLLIKKVMDCISFFA